MLEPRHRILAVLAGLSVVSYVLRSNISIAAKFIMPELGFDEVQMGQVFSAFLLGYSIFQIPAGILGDRVGPRRVLAWSALCWGLATLLTGVVPGWLATGAGALLSMLFLRFLLGVGEASTYPVAAKAIANCFPAIERSYANSIVVAGSSVGSALTPPAVAALMVTVGWRASFVLSAVLAFAGAVVWWWIAGDRPEAQWGSRSAEVSAIVDDRSLASTDASSSWWVLLRDRTILLLSLAYLLVGYVVYIFVFWLYLYLVDVRGFSVLGGGFFTSLPFVVAAFLTAAGGAVCDRLSRRFGGRKAARLVGATGCFLAAIFLVLGAMANQAYVAVAALALCVGFAEATEGAFWSTASEAGGPHAGTACGILNTFGNLGGVASTALVPILVREFGWVVALGSGSLFAVLAAATWLLIGAERAPEPSLETARI